MSVGSFGGDAAARSSLEKTDLEKIGFDEVCDGANVF